MNRQVAIWEVTIVPDRPPVSRQLFHAEMVIGLARASKHGRGRLADAMDLSAAGLDRVFTGSLPNAKRLWDARSLDPSVLDGIAALYDCRIVPAGTACAGDELAAPAVVRLLHKLVDAELDGAKDHRELLDMEPELRAVDEVVQKALARIASLRRPTAVSQ